MTAWSRCPACKMMVDDNNESKALHEDLYHNPTQPPPQHWADKLYWGEGRPPQPPALGAFPLIRRKLLNMFNGSGRDTKFGDRMRAAETRASDAERQNRALITLVKRLGELGIMQDDQYASAWKDIRPWLS